MQVEFICEQVELDERFDGVFIFFSFGENTIFDWGLPSVKFVLLLEYCTSFIWEVAKFL